MNRTISLIASALLTWGAVVLSILFLFDVYPPLRVTIVLLAVIACWGIASARANKFAIFQRLVILIYALPFAVTLGYLFDSRFLWASTPARLALIQDDLIILRMLVIGLVGLLGLLAGMKYAEFLFARRRLAVAPDSDNACRQSYSLPDWAFFGLGLVSLVLVWAGSGSTASIFETAYSGSSGIAELVNFNAATLLANVILIVLFLDGEFALAKGSVRRLQAVAVLAFLSVAYELFHGNRDSFGLLVALLALYISGDVASRLNLEFLQNWQRARRVAVPAFAVAIVFVLAGAVRVMLVNPEALAGVQYFMRVAFLENTWTAILHSNLGLASLYSGGSMDYLLGRTYIDYLQSLPPGFVAQALDYTRPIEADRGPAWWFMGITGGGVHAVVVPFRNFGIFGAFAVLALIGMLVTWLDAPNQSFVRRFFYGVAIAASFKWLWYGDMTLIRAMMAALIVLVAYKMLTSVRVRLA